MPHRHPDSDDSLTRLLNQLDDAATKICDGADLFNLDTLAIVLDDGLAGLMATEFTEDPRHLGELITTVADEVRLRYRLLTPIEFASEAEVDLPAVPMAQLRAALERQVLLAFDHAGQDGTVAVTARDSDHGISLELLASRVAAGDHTISEHRCASLHEFVAEFGAELMTAGDGQGQFALRIDFAE